VQLLPLVLRSGFCAAALLRLLLDVPDQANTSSSSSSVGMQLGIVDWAVGRGYITVGIVLLFDCLWLLHCYVASR
jgi:hypothetical protein